MDYLSGLALICSVLIVIYFVSERSVTRARVLGLLAFLFAECWVIVIGSVDALTRNMSRGLLPTWLWLTVLFVVAAVLMPIGWLACLWGSRFGRRLGLISAALICIVAVAYGVAVAYNGGAHPWLAGARAGNADLGPGLLASGAEIGLPVLGPPAALLWWGARRMAREARQVAARSNVTTNGTDGAPSGPPRRTRRGVPFGLVARWALGPSPAPDER